MGEMDVPFQSISIQCVFASSSSVLHCWKALHNMCVANTRVPAAGTLARMERFQPCSLSAARCEFLPSTHQVFWPRNFAREIFSRHSLSLENPFDHTPGFPIPPPVRWCRGQWGLWTFCEPVVVPTACARPSSWWPRSPWIPWLWVTSYIHGGS